MPLVEKPIHGRLRMRQPDPALSPHNLGALPEHRQLTLLWRFAGEYSRAEVEELMLEYTTRACPVNPYRPPRFTAAVPGDDGLHHLWRPDNGMVCSDLDTSLEGPWTHKAMFWWKDEGRPRQRTYTTKVQRTGDDIPAELVPPEEACWLARIEWKRNQQSPLSWPAWMGGNKPYTRIRWSIAQKLGTGCGVCGGAGVGVMDHDPFTGWLRGMLCDNCNNLIDTCPHITGCRFADYLNNPPAWHLRTAYPGLGKKYHNTRRRLARALDEWDPMLFAEIRRHEHPGQDGL